MATSGSTSWEISRDEIIKSALRKCGVLAKGQTPSAEDYSDTAVALNGLVARYNTLGMPLWKRSISNVSLSANTTEYTLSSALKLADVYVYTLSGTTQYRIQNKSEYDIYNLPYGTTGIPVYWSFTPNLAEGGTLRIWPTPDSSAASEYGIRAIYQEEFDTFTSSAETPDFPAYWTDALIYGLASSIAPEYGVSLPDRQDIDKKAVMFLAQAQSYGDEDGSIYFAPGQ